MTEPATAIEPFRLWSDEPSKVDLLAFSAVASTAAEALFDDDLDPVVIGLSGAWGSGKTTILELIKAEIGKLSSDDHKVLVVSTQPWRYDPAVGPKETLVTEVLQTLRDQVKDNSGLASEAKDHALAILSKLAKRVNWAKALKVAARSALTVSLPKLDDILSLVREDEDQTDLTSTKSMDDFRAEFEELLASDALNDVARVVVLVDDLDRCLPDTVVESLETIRLFLAVPGMSFVIAADEDRVADAISQKLGMPNPAAEEGPARLYLHKIVHTTIPLPGLSQFDTQAYIFLLLARHDADNRYAALIEQCDKLRSEGGSLDDLVIDDTLVPHLATATRLTPILYEKFHASPRRIKRFLNDVSVRESVALKRGFALQPEAIAKLMVLERILTPDFTTVIGWLEKNELRDRLDALDRTANAVADTTPADAEARDDSDGAATRSPKRPPARKVETPAIEAPSPATEDAFSDTLIRWAKLQPTLDATDVSGYLYLAAAFAKIEVTDTGLPERLRDLAARLASSLRLDRAGVGDGDINALSDADAITLLTHLGRRTRDLPSIQKSTSESILRMATLKPTVSKAAVEALKAIPGTDLEPTTILKLRLRDAATYQAVLDEWKRTATADEAQTTIHMVEEEWAKPNGN
ncbi:MAG: KAP family NTPase [Propionibacteriaceae bacterium]|nr:KAP family NTPase [Propionibacteriaceae bacterium]